MDYFFISLLSALGLHCCAPAFSSCREWQLLSSHDVQASHCFSCRKAWALRHLSSVAAVPRL